MKVLLFKKEDQVRSTIIETEVLFDSISRELVIRRYQTTHNHRLQDPDQGEIRISWKSILGTLHKHQIKID